MENQPNLFNLAGRGIQVTYATTGFTGRPSLTYHDTAIAKSFSGDELRVQEGEGGHLVSVSLTRTVDTGYTSFTLLVPRVNLISGAPAQITTLAITGVHRLTVDAPSFGQLDHYSTTRLRGTASLVEF